MGYDEFNAAVTDGGHLRIEKEGSRIPYGGFPKPENLPSGWTGKVKVNLILTKNPLSLHTIVAQNLVTVFHHSRDGKPIPDYLRTQLVDWEERHSHLADWENVVDLVLHESGHSEYVKIMVDRVRRTADAIFQVKGLSLTPDEFIEQAHALLSEDGFLHVLEDSPQLVLDAAALSICAALRVSVTSLKGWEWTLGEAFETANHINDRFEFSLGFKPFIIENGRVVFSMI